MKKWQIHCLRFCQFSMTEFTVIFGKLNQFKCCSLQFFLSNHSKHSFSVFPIKLYEFLMNICIKYTFPFNRSIFTSFSEVNFHFALVLVLILVKLKVCYKFPKNMLRICSCWSLSLLYTTILFDFKDFPFITNVLQQISCNRFFFISNSWRTSSMLLTSLLTFFMYKVNLLILPLIIWFICISLFTCVYSEYATYSPYFEFRINAALKYATIFLLLHLFIN